MIRIHKDLTKIEIKLGKQLSIIRWRNEYNDSQTSALLIFIIAFSFYRAGPAIACVETKISLLKGMLLTASDASDKARKRYDVISTRSFSILQFLRVSKFYANWTIDNKS